MQAYTEGISDMAQWRGWTNFSYWGPGNGNGGFWSAIDASGATIYIAAIEGKVDVYAVNRLVGVPIRLFLADEFTDNARKLIGERGAVAAPLPRYSPLKSAYTNLSQSGMLLPPQNGPTIRLRDPVRVFIGASPGMILFFDHNFEYFPRTVADN
jgi:hypothetical protein